MVKDGEITVNGEPCLNPGLRVTPDVDVVRHGRRAVNSKQFLTILFHKPRGLVCTRNDELKRPTIYQCLPPKYSHLNHVGRLDQDSEGLLVLTNHGDFANRLSHPSHKTEKEYIVTISSSFNSEVLDKFVSGIHTPLGKLQAKSVRRLSPRRVSIVLETGVKRQIREMFKAQHLRVTKLMRIRIGSLTDPTLPAGRHRPLDEEEIELLLKNPLSKPRQVRNRPTPAGPARKQAARKQSRDGGPKNSGGRSGSRNTPKKSTPTQRHSKRKVGGKGPGPRRPGR